MPLTVSNPRDLLLAGLADLLFVERMLRFEVLPQLIEQVADPDLEAVLAEHLDQTARHVAAVEDAFRALGAEPSSDRSPALDGLRAQHAQLAGSIKAPALADAWHATAAIHTEHYEIAAYRRLLAMAARLGAGDLDELLAGNLRDEEAALERLEAVADALA